MIEQSKNKLPDMSDSELLDLLKRSKAGIGTHEVYSEITRRSLEDQRASSNMAIKAAKATIETAQSMKKSAFWTAFSAGMLALTAIIAAIGVFIG